MRNRISIGGERAAERELKLMLERMQMVLRDRSVLRGQWKLLEEQARQLTSEQARELRLEQEMIRRQGINLRLELEHVQKQVQGLELELELAHNSVATQ